MGRSFKIQSYVHRVHTWRHISRKFSTLSALLCVCSEARTSWRRFMIWLEGQHCFWLDQRRLIANGVVVALPKKEVVLTRHVRATLSQPSTMWPARQAQIEAPETHRSRLRLKSYMVLQRDNEHDWSVSIDSDNYQVIVSREHAQLTSLSEY